MKLAVIGSRNFNDYKQLASELDRLKLKLTCIVSGGARGADQLAARYAKEHNIPLIEYLPDYEKHGRSAPLVRNKLIVDDADEVLAFWDYKTTGTGHSIKYAQKQHKPVMIVNYVKYKALQQ